MKTFMTWLLFGTFLVGLIPVAFATTAHDIASQLICTCGCTMIVSDCNCGTADDIRALIQGELDQGDDAASIREYFVSEYGEKVLAAPTKSGFNLTAWVLPFVALLGAIIGVSFVIRAWTRSGRPTESMPVPLMQDAQAQERLKRELDAFDA